MGERKITDRWRWLRRMRARMGRRPSLVALALVFGLLVSGGFASGGLLSTDQNSDEGQSRLHLFQDAAPSAWDFFAQLFSRTDPGASPSDDVLVLITAEVREEFFRTLPFGEIIHQKAEKYDVDPSLVAAVIETESSFRLNARSPKGALGLMQLMPSTGRWMGARNLFDPSQNIDAGTKYLRYLEGRFEGDLSRQLAAYNAGEGVVERFGGVPPYPETERYIERVMESYERRVRELEVFQKDWLEREAMGLLE
jgi:soluble lytic murein transglycosylase-like protein